MKPLNIQETLAETKKRCKKMTRAELMAEVNRAIKLAKSFFDGGQDTLKICEQLQSDVHCYLEMKGEARCAAKVLRAIADDKPPAAFLVHMADYLKLISEA